MNNKRELRKAFTQIRNSIDKKQRELYSGIIADKLMQSDFYMAANVVFIYVSIGSEVETINLIDKMISDGKTVTAPICDAESHTMMAAVIKSRDELKIGTYKIPEPKNSSQIIKKSLIDLCIVPALSFDRMGMRLGYGAGFYDRFLRDYKGTSVGIAYDECVAERLPHDKFDVAVDAIITPQEFIRF